MNAALPRVYVARHGETEWSLAGKHTGRSDPPLTSRGEANAMRLRQRLQGLSFATALTSPSQRARRTCELAGFAAVAKVDPDLAEWDYGQYEGLRTDEIRKTRPDWQLFLDGCPGGESVQDICVRADRVISRLRTLDANIMVFSSAHITRVIAARWLGLPASAGRLFALDTAALSILGYEHSRAQPAVLLWNDCQHTVRSS